MLFGSRREAWHDALARMTPARFEGLLAEHFRAEGWSVERAGAPLAARMHDGGIDLALRRDDGRFVIAHCKRWNAYQVPPADVERLAEAMRSERATGAIFVTCGEFSHAAMRVARRHRDLALVDGTVARSWLLPPASTAVARTNPARAAADRRRAPSRRRRAMRWIVVALVAVLVATAALVPFVPALAERAAAVLRWARIADPMRQIDHERARETAMKLAGVRSAFWLDGDDFVVMVAGRGRRTMATIDAVCRALEPLGDTLGVVVNVQDVTATRVEETKTLSRNCRLPEGERATFQRKRTIGAE
ncbi:restriction endonuclease [Dokdonella sp.]|uniref:restriction endonuclease n=1 Tax=Dokdonella sp. TaxID=2291710 RepID=UPI002F42E29D